MKKVRPKKTSDLLVWEDDVPKFRAKLVSTKDEKYHQVEIRAKLTAGALLCIVSTNNGYATKGFKRPDQIKKSSQGGYYDADGNYQYGKVKSTKGLHVHLEMNPQKPAQFTFKELEELTAVIAEAKDYLSLVNV